MKRALKAQAPLTLLLVFLTAYFGVPGLNLAPFSAFAADEESKPKKSFWERHGKVEDPTTAPSFEAAPKPEGPIEQTPLTLDNLRVPTQHGSLKESFAAKEPIVIHIQDAHANYEAQKHLSGILEHLILHHGLSLVLVEGGSRNDSLSYMRTYAPLEKRKSVAEEFLKAGKISGENFLDLTSDYPFTVYGIEKPELYDQNMEAFFNVEKVQPDALTAINGFRQAVAELKEKLYPDPVKALELKEIEVQAGRVPLAAHYQELSDEAGKLKLPLGSGEYPNLTSFLTASRLEGEIDFKQVEKERTRFLESLTKSLPKAEMDGLLNQSLELKKGLITPATFYAILKGHLKPEQAAEYPVLARYIEYLGLFEGIDHAALFTEVEGLSGRVKEAYFTTREQRDLARIAKDVSVMGDLLELKLTPDSYDYYASHKGEFKPDRWADDLRGLGTKQKPALTFALTPGPLNAAKPAMSSFYEVARQRDLAMVENALKRIEEFKVPFAVMIAGGFHTPAFERLFKDRKVSYAVVAPKVGKVTAADTEKYHRVLKETYVPMSEPYRRKLGVPGTPDLHTSQLVEEEEKETRAIASEIRPLAFAEKTRTP
ncbi:MAG: hypothetical protein HYS41_04405 [Candidatus Omnitrophica bacterium]|nr:hypothetical protein [Candidatus Omnitrophota bacterium]